MGNVIGNTQPLLGKFDLRDDEVRHGLIPIRRQRIERQAEISSLLRRERFARDAHDGNFFPMHFAAIHTVKDAVYVHGVQAPVASVRDFAVHLDNPLLHEIFGGLYADIA